MAVYYFLSVEPQLGKVLPNYTLSTSSGLTVFSESK